jgi:hypothetical protein
MGVLQLVARTAKKVSAIMLKERNFLGEKIFDHFNGRMLTIGKSTRVMRYYSLSNRMGSGAIFQINFLPGSTNIYCFNVSEMTCVHLSNTNEFTVAKQL